MAKRSTVNGRRAPILQGKATTFRIEPSVRQAMLKLQTVLKKPLNRLVNEALQGSSKSSRSKPTFSRF